jgi:hypothetical protein
MASWTPPSTPGNYMVRVTNSKGTTTSILTTGAVGATGPQGPIGLTGAPGAAGTSAPVHVIGESYQGGIVFYVDADGQHGLIAARADQSAGIQWNNGVAKLTGTSGDGLGAGVMNTAIIVATQLSDNPTGNFAAKVAADYSVQEDGVSACTSPTYRSPASEKCYGDWYLPSKVELNLLWNEQGVVGGFAPIEYWSSTENVAGSAWFQNFYSSGENTAPKTDTFKVRAIRAF